MKKFLFLFCALMLSAVGMKAQDDLQGAYEAAMAAIEDGSSYRIFTEWNGQKYYLNAGGYLVSDVKKAPAFTFSKIAGEEFEYGFNLLDSYFTNPPAGGNPTLNNGHIDTNPGSKRATWEAQVFFLKDGKYAVRATNATGGDSGWALNAKTFWTVNEGPVAEYSFEPSYVWQIEKFVDNRPEIFAKLNMDKVKAWAGKLQSMGGLVKEGNQWISNAKDPEEGSYEALLDGDYTTFFHSTWHGGEYDPQADHYLQAELSEAVNEFYFYFVKRDPINNANVNNRPTDIIISAGNDAETLANVTEVTNGLPSGITPPDYISDKITMSEANKFIRFTVTKTNNMAKTGDHVFFTFSEFYILPVNEATEAAIPYMKLADYTDLDFDADADAINAGIDAVDQLIEDMTTIVEVDYTNRVGIDSGSWKGASGLCATNFAPAITTKDGRTAQLAENYQTNVDFTGDLIVQTVTGLANGTYRVSIYANAFYTSGRGFESDVVDGAEDVCYVFAGKGANRVEKFITARIATETSANDLRTLENVVVTDGTLEIGLGKAKPGTNWHTVQVYEITALVNKHDFITSVYAPLGEVLAEGEAIKANVPADSPAIAEYESAIANAKAGYEGKTLFDINNPSDYTAINNAIAAVEAALPALAKAQTAAGSDMTLVLQNPQVNGADGWTIERPLGGNGPLLNGTSFEYWAGNASNRAEASFDYYQVITGLPAGKYSISADMYNSLNGEGGDYTEFRPTCGLYATSGENTVVSLVGVDGTELINYTTEPIEVLDGTLRLGVKNAETPIAARWFVADNFTLKLVEPIIPVDLDKAYEQALAAIESGKTYRIFTEKGGQKFYLDAGGYLIDNVKKAPSFTFTAVTADGTYYETGWNLGCKFTNPETHGQTTFENDGHIHVGGNDRNDWERQVFFLNNEGKYAVRATNADNPAWGSNTYWDVFDSAELPEAGYSLDPAYVWQIEEFVDNRPEIFASLNMDKVQAWAGKLQSIEGLVTDGSQWISNAKDPAEGSYEALLDGDYTTFFHSTWHGGEYDPQADHFLQAELPEATKEFYIYFKKRSQNNNNRPTQIDITASTDGENFTTEPISITEGLPTGATPIDYMSAKITLEEPSKFIRFTVPTTNNMAKTGDHVFFTFSEFYILPANELTAAVVPYMQLGDYTDLDFDADAAAINAAIDNVDKQIEEAIAAAEKEKAYNNALAAIEDGKFYRIFTEVDGQKYYVTEDGKLANVTDDGGIFSFTKVAGEEYPYGFKLADSYFTNPGLNGNDVILNSGQINTNASARDLWEAQVFFLKDGKYAVRATNAKGGESGWALTAKTYWTVNEGPVAEYSFEPSFVWQLEGPLTPIQVTYALYDADGTEPSSTVTKRQDANSEIKVPADMTSHFAYDYTTEGTIGEEDCTIKVIRTFKKGVVLSFDDLSNTKAYTIRCDRGALLTKDGYLASTAHSTLTDAEPAEFAIINNDGNYYLYSVTDKKFVLNNGALAEAPSHGVEDAIKMEADTNPYFFWYFTINGTNNGLNTNGANPYGYVIDNWMTKDEGNLYYMIESSDFDATEALAYFPATYTVSEAHDYGHWYRADVEGDSIAYSFAFNNSYKSADEILQVQVADAESDSLINHVNKGVFVLNEGFRINTGGDRYVQKFTLTVPRDYEIIDYTIDNSIPGAARGLYKYSLNEDMSNAVLIGADLYNLYEGNEETKDIISEEVGGTRQFNFYLEPVITDEGGSIIDVVLKVNVRRIQHVDVASTAVKSVKYNGVDVVFEDGIANMEGTYDAENTLEVELDDEKATYEIEYDEEENCVIIIVKGADFNYDPQNVDIYVIVFEAAEEPISTGIEGIALNEKQTIFDLAGRRVAKAQKGVYIINGKKVMVK